MKAKSPTPKKRVGDYELAEVLGEGTFATVRRARHVKTGMEYAVKCIDKSKIEKLRMGKQLKREIAIMRMIKHPRVVEFYHVLASKTKIYLVLELVTGGELFELLVKERGFGEEKARFFFQQLVEGVKCCHEKGICHRDLKPENLLLDENSELKISDFGLSALHDNTGDATLTSSKMLHTTCGSPNYVSPEVLDGEGYDGRKSDIWTLGVILYVLATGKLPFDESTMSELFAAIQRASYKPFPTGLSSSFKDLVSKLLRANPRERPQIAEIQDHEWFT